MEAQDSKLMQPWRALVAGIKRESGWLELRHDETNGLAACGAMAAPRGSVQ
jgi:hypothetical protein